MTEPTTDPGDSVLLVEDDADIRSALSDMLRDEGHTIEAVQNGAEALAYLHARPRPAVILLDWRMPVMGGEQFMIERQKHAAMVRVPVVVLSADRGEANKALALGVDAYVEKPVDIDRLMAALARFTTPVPRA